MGPRPHPEFRLFVSASDVPPAGKEVGFEADERTLKDLAKRFGIPEVVSLSGVAKVRPYRKAGLTVEGRFKAEVVQSCVVTLEPVHQKIEESFTQRYLPEHMIVPDVPEVSEREVEIDLEAEDAPEPMTGNGVDIGEAVAERLALALDPYPRKPDAAFEAPAEEPGDAPESKPNPFAALEKLKKNY
jgi:uncharacterized metal-binding protein YceD (DUF177 family)